MFNRIHWICLSNCPQITTTINVELIFCFIGNLDIFPLIATSNFDSIDELTRILKIIGQCDVKHMTFMIKNNNLSFEGLDIHYHSYWTLCYLS